MMVDTENLISMKEANQNFSKVVHTVDENGMAVILKNNKPRYIVVDFDEYDKINSALQMRKEMIESTAEKILDDNIEAFLELAK
ncbi:MAG: type II toxin-antitoxin system Phd/YefM family antitoxin [Ruminococcaceae bacterium]|nr:type II toxin-antitoxin system Phd/YefM family antitoxin [Oscillospiraceae bacterium]MBR3595471.1 type II toxin-antitoxin system Phd/YefM family antitoxin [Clostridia bacterium]